MYKLGISAKSSHFYVMYESLKPKQHYFLLDVHFVLMSKYENDLIMVFIGHKQQILIYIGCKVNSQFKVAIPSGRVKTGEVL